MLNQISEEIKKNLNKFTDEEAIIFNNRLIKINKENFSSINKRSENKTIAFIDGGQAEILSAGNFCLSFIRVFAVVFRDNKKINEEKNEFYLLTTAKYINDDLFYKSKIFPLNDEKLIEENDLLISSQDQTIKTGMERAPIVKVANIARRFAELSLANKIAADFVVLDGTLEKTYQNEEKFLDQLRGNVGALAKSSSLFTTSGNSPVIVLNKIGLDGCWDYRIDESTSFVKLNEKAKYVFRFEGNKEILPFLVENSNDALFLGYPYGLILVDKMARVSNEEKNSLKMKFLLKAENKEIVESLNSLNAHDILDNLGA